MSIVALDVDEVCADLHSEWLRRYNEDSLDSLLPEDIKTWEIERYVKKGWEEKIFDYLQDHNLYTSVLPMPWARTAIEQLREDGHRVIFVTACIPGTELKKRRWLEWWGFLTAAQDFVVTTDKSLIRADFLFDDRPENVESFKGGIGVLVVRPHNEGSSWHGNRVQSLRYAPQFVRDATRGLPVTRVFL